MLYCPGCNPKPGKARVDMTQGTAFLVMPFGCKPGPDGKDIDFDRVYHDYLKPAVEATGLRPHRADAERRGGSIHADMFQDLLMAELVVADLTVDNPNVWYEIGVRHALRASGAVLTYALRSKLPFDLNGQRMLHYTLTDGVPDPANLAAERAALTEAITATLEAWKGRKASPVYAQLPNLREPDWKSLKVGDVNEFWQALETWQGRIRVAQQRQRPGDILLLAEETPNRSLELEALRIAAKALIDLNRPFYALDTLKKALAIDPDDVKCRQMLGITLGRTGRFEEAREALQSLAAGHRDGETLGLLARTWKDQWRRLWDTHALRQTDARGAAKLTAATLTQAAEAYVKAFQANPAEYYPGINALMLGRLWEDVTGRKSKLDLALVAQGVLWAVSCKLAGERDYWALVTRAEIALLEGDEEAMRDHYDEAAALAVNDGKSFDLDSSSQTLDFLRDLGFRPEPVGAAAEIIDGAEVQLQALHRAKPDQPTRPARVVVFSGHMIDRPDRAQPRFPEAKAGAAEQHIAEAIDKLGVGRGDLGVTQAACGGDLLFIRACLARGMRLEIYLPQHEPDFLRDSVSYGAAHWQDEYDAVRKHPDATFRVMPDELGPAPEGINLYDRCNRWMLYSGLSNGLSKVSFVALWDGRRGDGPGGTEHMIELVRKVTGRQAVRIDPATL
jgi:tetratricopeptide (TPR) repeat protein